VSRSPRYSTAFSVRLGSNIFEHGPPWP
jgi:hypothetical protein